MSDLEIDVKIEQHHAGNRLTRNRAQNRMRLIDVRIELARSQAALAQAIDPEKIAEAQLALAEALERLRALR